MDVFGFHTGAYIASELAVSRPDLVRRVVLSGIAFKSPAERQQILDALPKEYSFPEDATRLLNRWYRIVTTREPGVTLQRAQRLFHEDTKALGYWWFAYHAVWNWPVEERLPKITQPVLIVEPHEMLLEDTRRAHQQLLPSATYVELPELRVESRVFETGSPLYAREMRKWLDR
ncbi:MAG: alpha/beta hydrolase [Proteobacteria bacterium]|nr:alpha/beta hydrolase [Pseudomonadota bacterium]